MASPQTGTIPPPPPGFQPVAGSVSASIPPPPPGFQPVSSGTSQETNLPNSVFGNEDTNNVLENMAAGFSKEANKSAQGVIDLANKGIHKLGGSADAIPSLPLTRLGENYDTQGKAQGAGAGLETVAEFAAGDEALSGLARAAKVVQLADKYPLIARTLELAKDHPIIAKMIGEAGKGAVVGGAQGAVKGATEGNAIGEAESQAMGGAIGGVAGTAVGETASKIAKEIGERVGLIPNVTRDASIGMKPRKGNLQAVADFMRIAPKIDAINQASPVKAATIADWANIAKEIRENVYQQYVEPLLARYGGRPLSGIDIANRIRSEISPILKQVSPEKAAIVEQFANQFLPDQVFHLTANDAEQYIQQFNAELVATGYWTKDPSTRKALEKVNPDIIKWKAAADAIRDELYSKLGDWQEEDHIPSPTNMAEAKKDYGAARNIENELRGQINVQNRQSKISLKELIALAAGVATGGVHGAAVTALPVLDRTFNSGPESFGRAVKAVSRPTEGIAPKVVKTGTAITNAVEGGAANVGSQLGRIFFTASDGSEHSIPDNENALAHARDIDPNLTVHSPQQ